MKRLALLLLLAAPLVAQPADPKGWRNLRWGMSEAAVEKAEPRLAERLPALKPDRDNTFKAFKNGEIELVGEKFAVWLLFSGEPGTGALASVRLTPLEKKSPGATYSRLRTALVEKYGAPTEEKDESRRDTTDKTCTWLLGQTKIELLEMEMGDGAFVGLSYSKRALENPNL